MNRSDTKKVALLIGAVAWVIFASVSGCSKKEEGKEVSAVPVPQKKQRIVKWYPTLEEEVNIGCVLGVSMVYVGFDKTPAPLLVPSQQEGGLEPEACTSETFEETHQDIIYRSPQ